MKAQSNILKYKKFEDLYKYHYISYILYSSHLVNLKNKHLHILIYNIIYIIFLNIKFISNININFFHE